MERTAPASSRRKCLIFESAAFVFLRGGESWRECVCLGSGACPASLPAGGPGPESRTQRKGRGADAPFGVTVWSFFRNDFRAAFPPPHPPPLLQKGLAFSGHSFLMEKPSEKKKKSHQDICCPVFLGVLQPRMQWLRFAEPSSRATGNFSCTTRRGIRSPGPVLGCTDCLRAEGACTFLNPLASRRSNSLSLSLDRAGQ